MGNGVLPDIEPECQLWPLGKTAYADCGYGCGRIQLALKALISQ
jgi:hypothetical protein